MWWRHLEDIIGEIRSQGGSPVVIAISRKMPRLVNWFCKICPEAKLQGFGFDCLRDVIFTSELAIPFLFCQSGVEPDSEVVIIDDFIIRGSALRNVTDTIFDLTGKESHVCCVFRRYESIYADNINREDLNSIPLLPQAKIDEFSDIISQLVYETQLPIDMEFPIIRISEGYESIVKIRDYLENEQNNNRRFVDEGENRFCLDYLPNHNEREIPDFQKIRFFLSTHDTMVEVFSPYVFMENDLASLETSIFSNELYQSYWERTTRKIRLVLAGYETTGNSEESNSWRLLFMRSLCVWANYLFSLSLLVRSIHEMLPHLDYNQFKLSFPDLSLIIGEDLASEIYGGLLYMVLTGDKTSLHCERPLDAPYSLYPKSFREEVIQIKNIELFKADSPSNLFDGIFRYEHYTNEKFSNPLIAYERMSFGETFQSLYKAMSLYFDEDRHVRELIRWVDDNIDRGYIIPKYERVKTRNNSTCWRRFFHSGIRRK